MRTYQFYQLDVFTDKPFAGNPLAVFPDAAGISDDEMQKIAMEMNLSETVFVLPSDKPEAVRRLRIFTPTSELPMAGHPVVGTWNLLAQLGFVENAPQNGSVEIKQELGIGVLPVEIEFVEGKPVQVTMTQGKFTPNETINNKEVLGTIAQAFNFTPDDFMPDAPVQIAGTGVNFLLIPVRSLKALENSRANVAKLEEFPAHFPGSFSLFTTETLEKTSKIHTRMYAPLFGIVEDPATGSAAGALGGYLLHNGLLEGDIHRFTIEQGDFMKRPSRIHIEVTGTTGNVEKVRCGGQAIVVARGELFL